MCLVETVRGQREHARKCDEVLATVEAFILATVAAQLVNRYLGSRHPQAQSRSWTCPRVRAARPTRLQNSRALDESDRGSMAAICC